MQFFIAFAVGAIVVLLLTYRGSRKDESSKYKQLETVEKLKKLSLRLSEGSSSPDDKKEWDDCMKTLEGIAFKGYESIDKFYMDMKEQYLEYIKKYHS